MLKPALLLTVLFSILRTLSSTPCAVRSGSFILYGTCVSQEFCESRRSVVNGPCNSGGICCTRFNARDCPDIPACHQSCENQEDYLRRNDCPFPSPHPSASSSPSVTPSPSVTTSPSWSPTPSVSISPSQTPSPSVSASATSSPSHSSTPSPTVTPQPSISANPTSNTCPCTCRTGTKGRRAVSSKCGRQLAFASCQVSTCSHYGRRGLQCCDRPLRRSPEPRVCPCICRRGWPASPQARRDCARRRALRRCQVKPCLRRSRPWGHACC